MCDDNHGKALSCQLAHDLQHLAHHLRVQCRCGLVKQQHLRLHGQCPGNGHPLFLSAGKLSGLGVDIRSHPHLFQVIHGILVGICLVLLKHLDLSDYTVLQHSHVVKQIKALEHHSHLGAVLGRIDLLIGNIGSMVHNFACGRRFQKIQTSEQCGFSGTRRTDDAGHIPAAD